jgi:hypothetical protein
MVQVRRHQIREEVQNPDLCSQKIVTASCQLLDINRQYFPRRFFDRSGLKLRLGAKAGQQL